MIQIGFCDDDLSILSELRVLLDRYRVERNVEIASAAFQSPLELLTEIERGPRFDNAGGERDRYRPGDPPV